MKNKYTFKVETAIKGKSRPRFNYKTKTAYKVRQDIIFERDVQNAFIETEQEISDKYLKLKLEMYFKIPKSYTKRRKEMCLKGVEKPAKRPDTDNVLKNVMDSLNGYAYHDDIQIVEIICAKYYSDNEEYMEITIEELN